MHVIKVEIDSDTPIALTGFILRCLSCSVMGELIEQGIVHDKALIEAAVDNELILRVAAKIRSTLAARCSLHFPQSLSPFTKVWLSRALSHAQTLTPSRLVSFARSGAYKEKARATAAWSALMFAYLLNKTHAHLIHSGTVVAGLFLESAMEDPKWQTLVARSVVNVCVQFDLGASLSATDTLIHVPDTHEHTPAWRPMSFPRT